MTDLSSLSDADLMALAQKMPAPSPLASLSNEELTALAKKNMVPTPGAYSGGILPFGRDEKGNLSFDSNAGFVGAIKRAVTAPGDVYTGKLDPLSPEGQRRAFETAALISPVNPAVRAGEYPIPGAMKALKRPEPPTAAALKDAAGAGYKAVRKTGAEYPGNVVGGLADDVTRALEADGLIAELTPQTFAVLNKLRSPPDGSVVTISSLDAARKALNRIAGNFQNRSEQEAARRVIERIDDFIQAGGKTPPMAGAPAATAGSASDRPRLGGPSPSPVDPAPTEQAARLIKDARGNAAAQFRSERITKAEDAAELRSAAANSGQNLGNTLRQRLADILIDPKKSRGYSQEELAAMRQVVEGTATTNTLRAVSNKFGGGGGIGQALVSGGAGSLASDPLLGALIGAGVYGTGKGTRAGYNALTQRQVGLLDEMIRRRSPLYQQTPHQPVNPMLDAMMIRGLLAQTPGLLEPE